MSDERTRQEENTPQVPTSEPATADSEDRFFQKWRPTRLVLWTLGLVSALVATVYLAGLLYPAKWEKISSDPATLLEGQIPTLIGIAVSLTGIIVLLAIGGASFGWTGFANKTIWEWLELLIVPVAIAAIGFAFTVQQEARQQQIESARARQAQNIENERAKAERKLAEERAQDEALQAYLSQMSSLLLDKDLRDSKEGNEVRTLARARTLTVLTRLDPSRKTAVLEFLVEAELVQSVEGTEPIIRLGGAELSGAELSGADLSDAELSYAVLTEAVLSDADLSGADLRYADLPYADLRWANLSGADLTEAYLPYASLGAANLRGADVSQADLSYADLPYAQNWTAGQLEEAYLEGTTMPNGQKFEIWREDKRRSTPTSPTPSPSSPSPSATSSASAGAGTEPHKSAP